MIHQHKAYANLLADMKASAERAAVRDTLRDCGMAVVREHAALDEYDRWKAEEAALAEHNYRVWDESWSFCSKCGTTDCVHAEPTDDFFGELDS